MPRSILSLALRVSRSVAREVGQPDTKKRRRRTWHRELEDRQTGKLSILILSSSCFELVGQRFRDESTRLIGICTETMEFVITEDTPYRCQRQGLFIGIFFSIGQNCYDLSSEYLDDACKQLSSG